MAKKLLEVTNFSGGLNSYSDARDIKDNQFVQNWNAIVDKAGIIRVSGMAENYINTESHSNSNFQNGFGLFQFSTEYSVSGLASDFNSGIKTGTLSAGGSSSATLEATYTGTLNQFENNMIFIYQGTGIGQSRTVASSTAAKPTVLTVDDAWGTNPDNTSKYRIYNWITDGDNWKGKAETDDVDFITNGSNANMYIGLPSSSSNDYYIFSKDTAADNQTVNLGYIEYASGISLTSGASNLISFDAAARNKWYNIISNGHEDGSTSTNYGDKVPWVQLYSEDIEDTSGCVRLIEDATPTGGTAGDATYLSTTWTVNTTGFQIFQDSSTGNGLGAEFACDTDGSGNPRFYLTQNKGVGYAAGEILTFSDPADSSKTANIQVKYINHIGLSLQANGSWISKTDQTKYLTNVNSNYIDNGDFADGPTNSWTLQDSSGNISYHLEAAATAYIGGNSGTGVSYDGDDGTVYLKAGSQAIQNDNGEAVSYIYQDLTLDDLTDYHFNFMFSTSFGLQYAIYDTTNSSYIINWTKVQGNRVPGNSSFWYSFPNRHESTQSGSSTTTMDYIRFKVPKNPKAVLADVASQAGTSSIQIRFAPIEPSAGFFLSGVTLHKAHNDLTSLSYQTSAACPFYDDITASFSKYNLKFAIPIAYNSVSTWKLRFHGGQYGFRNSNDLGQSDGVQATYFDNIKMSGDEGDVITMLTDNKSLGTNISLHSKSSDSWIPKMFSWTDSGAQPNYDYINGMLKISDGNFNTSNPNVLMYYSTFDSSDSIEERGWLRRYGASLHPPPYVKIGELNSDMLHPSTFNGVDYLNAIFANSHYIRKAYPDTTHEGGSATQSSSLFWKIGGQFGPGSLPTKHGLICKNIFDEDSLTPANGSYTVDSTYDTAKNWEPNIAKQIYNLDDLWTRMNILSPGDEDFIDSGHSEYNEDYDGLELTAAYTPAAGGYTNSSSPNSSVFNRSYGYRIKGGHPSPECAQFGYDRNHSEKAFPFYYQTHNGVAGLSPFITSNNLGPIAKIKTNITFIHHGANGANPSDASLPSFNLGVGLLNDGWSDSQAASHIRNGSAYNLAFNNTTRWATPYIGNQGDTLSWAALAEDSSLITNYDSSERIKEAIIRYESTDIGYHNIAEINFENEQLFDAEGTNSIQEGTTFAVLLRANQENNVIHNNNTNDMSGYLQCYDHSVAYGGGMWSNVTGVQDDWATGCEFAVPHTTNLERSSFNFFQTYFINELTISFYNTEWLDEFGDDVSSSSNQSKVSFVWDTPTSPSLGWGGRSYRVKTTVVNVFGEESSLSIQTGEVGVASDGTFYIPEGDAPELQVKLGVNIYNNYYITKTKYYMQASESEIWYLQCYIDHKTKKIYSSTSNYSSSALTSSGSYTASFVLPREHLKDFNEVNSYESETMVSQDDALVYNNANLMCRYKTSVVANNRLYVGNIYHAGRKYEDRMIKSPIGKYNILPQSNFIDVAINDGDSITGLAYYKDKILQFKKRKVFIINISGDYEFLEDTFQNVGVLQQCSIATTAHGIVWANRTGCYLYDGEKLTNLIDNVIPPTLDYATMTNNFWIASGAGFDGIPIVGYVENRDTIVVKFRAESNPVLTIPEGASYHFPTKSWAFIVGSFRGDTSQGPTGDLSNMITNDSGDLIYYHVYDNENINIKKWTHSSLTDSSNQKLFQFTTKDFTFGNIAVRKKLYKVYITYKSNSNTTVAVKGAVDGISDTGTFAILFSTTSVFKGTSTACYTGSSLQSTGNVWKTAELKFATPSEVNNLYTFQLNFLSASIPSDFQINDISISYRAKPIK